MAYYVGDIPAEDIVLEPARDGEPLPLDQFDGATSEVVLRDFEMVPVPADFLVTIDEDRVLLEWPGVSVFDHPGLYTLAVTLVGAHARERLAPVFLVVQDENGWHTLDTARAEWASAPASDIRMFQVLELARQQVLAFAPAFEGRVPVSYREGQLMQARNIWNAGAVNPGSGEMGDDSFMVQPFPLDWMVRQVLRPKRAIGAIG